jgi:hypothetical protein
MISFLQIFEIRSSYIYISEAPVLTHPSSSKQLDAVDHTGLAGHYICYLWKLPAAMHQEKAQLELSYELTRGG